MNKPSSMAYFFLTLVFTYSFFPLFLTVKKILGDTTLQNV